MDLGEPGEELLHRLQIGGGDGRKAPVGIQAVEPADVVALGGVFFPGQLLQVLRLIQIVRPFGDGLHPGIGPQGPDQGKILRRNGGQGHGVALSVAVLLEPAQGQGLVALHGHRINDLSAAGHLRPEEQRAFRLGIGGAEIVPPQKGAAHRAVADTAGLFVKIGPQDGDVLQGQGLELQHGLLSRSFLKWAAGGRSLVNFFIIAHLFADCTRKLRGFPGRKGMILL